MTDKYILQEPDFTKPIRCNDFMKWARWMENRCMSRRLAHDKVGEVRISTVFLGLDHNYSGKGPPILWETLVFGGEHDGEMERYSTYDAAEKGHAKMVALIKGEGK